MRIIAYTYLADVHCPDYTNVDACSGLLQRKPPLQLETDEHGLPYDLVDREGNNPTPIFSTDEHLELRCGDCGCRVQ